MEINPDDPPKSHEQNGDAENNAFTVDTPSSKEGTPYIDLCDQDEAQSGGNCTENPHTGSKTSEKLPCKLQQGAIFSGKILSFCCSECRGDTTYSPNDLLKHFQGAHKGTLPTYPCDLCTFVTNEFSSLQRHRIGHRDTLVTCELCSDGVQYSLLLLTRHFIMCHSCNGLFRCKKCDFSTRDAGTFVQHIHHHKESSHTCVKCPQISLPQGKINSGTFPFTCQLCGFGAAQRDHLSKHMALAHGDEIERTYKWRAMEENSRLNSPGLKLLLRKSPPSGGSREQQWMSKLNTLTGVGLLDHNGLLFNPEKTLEETQQFLERAVGVKKECNKWNKCPVNIEPQSSYPAASITPQIQETEHNTGSGILDPGNSNGLTVLMVKNKISIPPNCTTKVMGFKMVDGKKHLVLKVIPTKQEPDTKNETSPTDAINNEKISSFALVSERSESVLSLDSRPNTALRDIENKSGGQSPLLDKHKETMDKTRISKNQDVDKSPDSKRNHPAGVTSLSTSMNKEATFSNNQSNKSGSENNSRSDDKLVRPCSAADQHQSTCSTDSAAKSTEANDSKVKIASSKSFTKSTTADLSLDELSPSELTADRPKLPEVVTDFSSASVMDHPLSSQACSCIAVETMSLTVESLGHPVESAEGNVSTCDRITEQSSSRLSVISPLLSAEDKTSVVDESESSLSNCSFTPSSDMLNGQTKLFNDISLPVDSFPKQELVTAIRPGNNQSSDITSNEGNLLNASLQDKNGVCNCFDASIITATKAVLQNPPNQEVFSFHNYSKETFGSFPNILDAGDPSPQNVEKKEYDEEFDELKLSSDWSLTLPASPPLMAGKFEGCIGREGASSCSSNDLFAASEKKTLERVSDSDIEVDECIATVDESPIQNLADTEMEACFLDSGKNLEDMSLDEKGTATLSNAAVLGKILEEHSDAIITQQLEKDRMVSSVTTQDTNGPIKTTLRILQTPEGKRRMFLQTTETPYAVPVQLKSSPGFKLITNACASQVNVSYLKPGIDRCSKGTGLSLTLNGGRIGVPAHSLSGEDKGQKSLLHTVSNSGGRYIVSASALKGPLLLSGAVKSPSGEQTANRQPTCYIVQRPFSVAPVSTETTVLTSKSVLNSRPVLAMPVNPADKATPLQPGRQAYLVRYIAPAKSGILVNNPNEKGTNQNCQANEGGKSRVFLKIVKNLNGTKVLSTTPYPSSKHPLYVARSSLQSPYILMSSDNALTKLSAGIKASSTPNSPSYKLISANLKGIIPQSDINNKNLVKESLLMQKSSSMDACLRSPQRRRRRALFDESLEMPSKSRRLSSESYVEKEVALPWEPGEKHVERILRISPFSQFQMIKCPRQNQPVVVLNHPDADIPEVTNIMKSVNRHKSEVIKVTLSQNTVKALSEWSFSSSNGTLTKQNTCLVRGGSRLQSSNVRERFILKLKLKKKSRSKYEVVRSSSTVGPDQESVFHCWFCGRVFKNQEEWIGHGQRHLMEATRDWNKLF